MKLINSKSDQRFQRRFFKNCVKISISMPWKPEFLMESNSVAIFWKGPPMEHSCQVWSKLAQRFRRRRCLKKLLTTHDGHITTLKAPLGHVVLRWAKNIVHTFKGKSSRKMPRSICRPELLSIWKSAGQKINVNFQCSFHSLIVCQEASDLIAIISFL